MSIVIFHKKFPELAYNDRLEYMAILAQRCIDGWNVEFNELSII